MLYSVPNLNSLFQKLFSNFRMKHQILLLSCLSGLAFAKVSNSPIDHCQACQFIAGKIEHQIEQYVENLDQHMDEIQDAIQRVCDNSILNIVFGQDFNEECNQAVEHLPEIIHQWTNMNITYDPEMFCKHLGLCKVGNLKKPLFQNQPKTYHKDHCQICQFVVEKIESCIEEQAEDINEHIDEITATMQRVCDSHILNFIFGQDFTDECKNILEELPEIIDHWMNLNETFSPEFVCGNLGLCNNSTMF